MAEELFKSTLLGGFDKEDVLAHVERLKAEAWEAQEKLHREIEDREDKINQLKKRLELKDDQYARLESEIKEKYQKYVDNYESIGKLVFEAQLKADEIIGKMRRRKEETVSLLSKARWTGSWLRERNITWLFRRR